MPLKISIWTFRRTALRRSLGLPAVENLRLSKSLNRMNDLVEGCVIDGEIKLDGVDIYGNIDINELRKRVGMVFQKPNPFP